MRRALSALLLLALLLACTTALAEEETAEFYGVIGKRLTVYRWASDEAPELGKVEAGLVVDVYNKGRTWTSIDYEGRKGYVLTKFVERVQRKDPFAGPMPGTSEHIAVALVLSDTSFKPEGYHYPIQVSKGSWLSVEYIKNGRAYFPYMRLEDDVSLSTSNLKIYEFVPWADARPGDLIYAFTTFFTTSLNKTGNSGRLQNIALAAERLTGVIVPSSVSNSMRMS